MTMTYYDSAEDVEITKDRAYQELKKHGVEGDWSLFLSEMGDSATYDAQEVLEWLGY